MKSLVEVYLDPLKRIKVLFRFFSDTMIIVEDKLTLFILQVVKNISDIEVSWDFLAGDAVLNFSKFWCFIYSYLILMKCMCSYVHAFFKPVSKPLYVDSGILNCY